MGGSSGSTRRLGSVPVAVVLTVMLWVGADALLSSDRGLDLTDEGLYLLEADTPVGTAAWGTPYGWHTGPLFRLVGRDVAAFRTLGATILALASIWLCLEALRLGRTLSTDTSPSPDRAAWILPATAAAAGVLGGLLYYSGFLRTPSYNWVTVAGTTVAMAGFLRLVAAELRGGRSDRVLGIAATSFGLFLTIAAKPTTPVLFAPIGLLVLARRFGIARAMRSLVAIAVASAAWVGVAVLSGLWPAGFVEVFLTAATNPTPSDVQTVVGGGIALLRVPFDALVEQPLVALIVPALLTHVVLAAHGTESHRLARAWTSDALAYGLGGFAVLAAVIWSLTPILVPQVLRADVGLLDALLEGRDLLDVDFYVQRVRSAVAGVGLLAGGGAVLLLVARRRAHLTAWVAAGLAAIVPVLVILAAPGSLFGAAPTPRFVRAESTTALLGMLATLWAVSPIREGKEERHRGARDIAAALVLMAFVTGFGSGHEPYRQASLAAPLIVAAGVVLLAGSRPTLTMRRPAALVGGVLVVMSAVNIADSRAAPYRAAAVEQQVVPTRVGVDGAVLFLDEERSRLLAGLTHSALTAGWAPGTLMFGIVDWPSTLVWHLGARTPDSIMPALHLQRDRFDRTLASVAPSEWRGAWILLPAESNDGRRPVAEEFAGAFSGRVGRSFPEEYERVWAAPSSGDPYSDVELWRPRGD